MFLNAYYSQNYASIEVSWVRLPVTADFFTFLYFRFKTSKFIYFQLEARCFQDLYPLIES